MFRTLILAVALSACFVQTTRGEECSGKATCNDCLSHMGCQWCAAEAMWANASTTARCRSRWEASGSWCPAEQLVDPPDQQISEEEKHEDLADSPPHYVSPERVRVQSRRGNVQINFQIKTAAGEPEIKLVTEDQLTRRAVQLAGHTKEVAYTRNGWTVYSINATVEVKCPAGGAGKSTGELKLAVGMRSVSVVLTRSCDCDCGRAKEERSERCSGRGALHCGGCECGSGWSGASCQNRHCTERGRGDQDMSCLAPNGEECSGDGKCECGRCECRGPALAYFDDYCSEFCAATRPCALCYYRKHNTSDFYYSEASMGDSPSGNLHRCLEQCGSTQLVTSGLENTNACAVLDEDGCVVTYVGARLGGFPMLRLQGKNCSEEAGAIVAAAGGAAIGVAGAVVGALVAAGLVAWAGVALWKAAHAPSDALSGMQYEHMDAEANQGENPLYKPPTSSYNNPLYQQTKK